MRLFEMWLFADWKMNSVSIEQGLRLILSIHHLFNLSALRLFNSQISIIPLSPSLSLEDSQCLRTQISHDLGMLSPHCIAIPQEWLTVCQGSPIPAPNPASRLKSSRRIPSLGLGEQTCVYATRYTYYIYIYTHIIFDRQRYIDRLVYDQCVRPQTKAG